MNSYRHQSIGHRAPHLWSLIVLMLSMATLYPAFGGVTVAPKSQIGGSMAVMPLFDQVNLNPKYQHGVTSFVPYVSTARDSANGGVYHWMPRDGGVARLDFGSPLPLRCVAFWNGNNFYRQGLASFSLRISTTPDFSTGVTDLGKFTLAARGASGDSSNIAQVFLFPTTVGRYIEFTNHGSQGNGHGSWANQMLFESEVGPDVPLLVESLHGECSPPVGLSSQLWGTIVEATAPAFVEEGDIKYVCSGWNGSGSLPPSGLGSYVSFLITNATTIAWQWQEYYRFNASIIGSGSLNLTNGWVAPGASLTLQPTPEPGYVFIGWSGDFHGNHADTNAVVMFDRPKNVAAHFSSLQTVAADMASLIDSNRNSYGYYTLHDSVSIVASNRNDYGFYTADDIADMNPGGLNIAVSNNEVVLRLQVLISTNLSVWSEAGQPVIWRHPIETTGPRFFRVTVSEE